ncbi:hypothetical protein GCM10010988_29640 [Cnuibacter physcomitrellae]|uniref:Uncharacterized protein n=1 Tax=Cnuibacter physcomitrellae TaxID=1619308 RepID=A0A1X9LGB5_9MICO|nr:NAD(P)H-binding protein [Cnuibacter physcomitrellae]ARJ04224.1 hypothetical protein B5808_02520 [Cnuibacter physcomitrellae]MCS5497030.1 NAD(P)H-binding protein [Cnuibacter physcomitrellae]GGI40550.1 hypothetical protein GCM10010988_29640 [Cnuibacter physcomitrellae]
MEILIVGGNGHVGSRLGARLRELGHTVRIGSRQNGVDAVTGEGLGEAMAGADVVVDVLNTAEMDAAAATAFFQGTTERMLAAEQSTGVGHHVLLSIVGVDRARANGYYAGKVAQENAVRDADVSFSIVRATQFHDFVPTIADWLTVDGSVHAPGMLLQPVAVEDVVDLLAEVATSAPLNDVVAIAGAERYRLDDLLRATLAARADTREVVTVEGTALGADSADSLVPLGAHRTGSHPYPVAVPAVAQ